MAGPYARKTSTPSKPSAVTKTSSAKKNSSILNFFQKTDTTPGATTRQSRMTQFVTQSRSPSSGRSTPALQRGKGPQSDEVDGLFLEDKRGLDKIGHTTHSVTKDRARSATPEDIWGNDEGSQKLQDSRYNEQESSLKRRKVSSPVSTDGIMETENKTRPAPVKASNGPFIDESDSEDDAESYRELQETLSPSLVQPTQLSPINGAAAKNPSADHGHPPFVREATNYAEDYEFTNFDDLDEDELEREEFREQPWEHELGDDLEQGIDDEGEQPINMSEPCNGYTMHRSQISCPVCQKELAGLGETVCCTPEPVHIESSQ